MTNVGILGIHGFSRTHITHLLARQAAGECRIIGIVAHERERDPEYAASLEAQGLRLVPDFDALLALDPDLVTVPLGIHLHLPVTKQILAAGKHVYLEKPIAGCLAEVDAIAAAERASSRNVYIGFQDLFQRSHWDLRARLAAGEWGALRTITVNVGWPRARSYFARNDWAGKLRKGDSWVRDSIAHNACAHFINLAMFLAGGTPAGLTAELSRGYAIETFDTCSIRVRMSNGVVVLLNASHLSTDIIGPFLRVSCDGGQLTNDQLEANAPWRLPDGSEVPVTPRFAQPYVEVLAHLRGEPATICRIAEGRTLTQVIEHLHTRFSVQALPGIQADAERIWHPAMDEALRTALATGKTLGETGLLPGLATAQEIPF